MHGRIARIQVLWVDRQNPTMVNIWVIFQLFIPSSFYRFDSKLGTKKSTFEVTVKIHSTTNCAKNFSNERPVNFPLNCTKINTFSTNSPKVNSWVFSFLECYTEKKFMKLTNLPSDFTVTVDGFSHKSGRISKKPSSPKMKSRHSSQLSVSCYFPSSFSFLSRSSYRYLGKPCQLYPS